VVGKDRVANLYASRVFEYPDDNGADDRPMSKTMEGSEVCNGGIGDGSGITWVKYGRWLRPGRE
jgi:hypothetical protein